MAAGGSWRRRSRRAARLRFLRRAGSPSVRRCPLVAGSVAVLLGLGCFAAGPASADELRAPGPSGPLAGTFRPVADTHAQVVLIVPGSGAVDRDGNHPPVLLASTYRLLADALAARGIASLRIDKRGLFGSRAAIPDPDAVVMADYAADVRAWIEVVRARTGAGCVWLLGHSEGGLVALLAARPPAPVCGLVLLATPGRPIGQLIRAHLRANPANAPILPQAARILDALESGRLVPASAIDPVLLPLFRPAVQGLLVSELGLDPARLIGALHLPVLVVQGERDLQVGVPDALRLLAADPHASLALLPDANHVLKSVPADDRANRAAYADPALPLAPGVAERIAGFSRTSAPPR